jgi:hypothetical protein
MDAANTALEKFYTSLLKQNPKSKMAQDWVAKNLTKKMKSLGIAKSKPAKLTKPKPKS